MSKCKYEVVFNTLFSPATTFSKCKYEVVFNTPHLQKCAFRTCFCWQMKIQVSNHSFRNKICTAYSLWKTILRIGYFTSNTGYNRHKTRGKWDLVKRIIWHDTRQFNDTIVPNSCLHQHNHSTTKNSNNESNEHQKG